MLIPKRDGSVVYNLAEAQLLRERPARLYTMLFLVVCFKTC